MDQEFLVGQVHRVYLKVDLDTVERFADLSGDRNPIHLDEEEARAYGYPKQLAHGAVLTMLLSKLIGMEIPGPGAVWMSQSVDWIRPVFVGDDIELEAVVETISKSVGVISLTVNATNQNGDVVMKGNAKVKLAERMVPESSATSDITRVALITGGSRGIGAGIAKRLGQDGVVVAVNYKESKNAAELVVEHILKEGGSAQAFCADIGDQTSTKNMVDEIICSYGRLDIIVHGASPKIDRIDVADLTYSDIELFTDIYLRGALAQMEAALPGMTERKFGRIIFLGTSFMFNIPPSGVSAYIAAKYALWGLAKSMAAELGPKGITTNMVSPGMTVTDLISDLPVRIKELEARNSPMRRLATVQDTAELVRFLASDLAGYINGAHLPITGGSV